MLIKEWMNLNCSFDLNMLTNYVPILEFSRPNRRGKFVCFGGFASGGLNTVIVLYLPNATLILWPILLVLLEWCRMCFLCWWRWRLPNKTHALIDMPRIKGVYFFHDSLFGDNINMKKTGPWLFLYHPWLPIYHIKILALNHSSLFQPTTLHQSHPTEVLQGRGRER